ncbi:hypothetical protein B0H19DRAFT_1253810 [Mycena capillaripes]|nr:hypothetical protein B0H19DRAFT_1253810 [Mycena capillaripes]
MQSRAPLRSLPDPLTLHSPWERVRRSGSRILDRVGTSRRSADALTVDPPSMTRLSSPPPPTKLHSPWERARKSGSRVIDVDARGSLPGPKRVGDKGLALPLDGAGAAARDRSLELG